MTQRCTWPGCEWDAYRIIDVAIGDTGPTIGGILLCDYHAGMVGTSSPLSLRRQWELDVNGGRGTGAGYYAQHNNKGGI